MASGKIKVKAESAKEFREAQGHAEALGLSLDELYFGGNWEDDEGRPVFLSGSTYEPESVGHKYFHLSLNGPDGMEEVPCIPGRKSSTKDSGYVKATFTGGSH